MSSSAPPGRAPCGAARRPGYPAAVGRPPRSPRRCCAKAAREHARLEHVRVEVDHGHSRALMLLSRRGGPIVPRYGIRAADAREGREGPERDGAWIAADVIRSPGGDPAPAIVTLTPYGKDVFWLERYPDHGVDVSPYAVWETPDPGWWVPRGYACVRADSRGIGNSPGRLILSRTDTEDYYDLIEWVATQPWCNGRVALLGISFYAIVQWKVAALRPPHLAAIVPWEGANDLYRDWTTTGGSTATASSTSVAAALHRPAARHRSRRSTGARSSSGARSTTSGTASGRRSSSGSRCLAVGRQLGRVPPPPSRQHRGLRAGGLAPQAARDDDRHPHRPVLHRVGPGRAAALPRPLVQGRAQRRRGRRAAAPGDPPRRRDRVARRVRVAARAHAVAAPASRCRRSLSALEPPAAAAQTAYDAPEGAARFETAPFAEPTEITGPVVLRVWVSADAAGHGPVRRAARHRRRRRRAARDRAPRRRRADGGRLAARLAPRARPGALAPTGPGTATRARWRCRTNRSRSTSRSGRPASSSSPATGWCSSCAPTTST